MSIAKCNGYNKRMGDGRNTFSACHRSLLHNKKNSPTTAAEHLHKKQHLLDAGDNSYMLMYLQLTLVLISPN